jgi:hypothetical protein
LRHLLDADQAPPRVQEQYLERLHVLDAVLLPQKSGDCFRVVEHGRFTLQFLRDLASERERGNKGHGLVTADSPDALQVVH